MSVPETRKAGQAWEKALELDSGCLDAYKNLGIFYYVGGNPAKAVRYLREFFARGGRDDRLRKVYEELARKSR